jgi:hypothetical protein
MHSTGGEEAGAFWTLQGGIRRDNLWQRTQQHGMILISRNDEISSRLYAFSLFFPGSCPNNRDHRIRHCGLPGVFGRPLETIGGHPVLSELTTG